MQRLRRVLSILLSLVLVFPVQFLSAGSSRGVGNKGEGPGIRRAYAGFRRAGSSPLQQNSQNRQPNFRQLVIFIPDVFDNPQQIQKALKKLQAKGLPEKDIINLALHPEFDCRAGLQSQSAQLAKIVDLESARRQGLRAYLIAKGTGGLVAQYYLATARTGHLPGAPVESVVGLGVPHQGRTWAKWAYLLFIPLPRVGLRSVALRDLAPDSKFMLELNRLVRKRRYLLRGAQDTLAAVRKHSFNEKMRNQLAVMDQEKSAIAEKVEQQLMFPERRTLSESALRPIRQMQAEQKTLRTFNDKIRATAYGVKKTNFTRWSQRAYQMQTKLDQRARREWEQARSGGSPQRGKTNIKLDELVRALETQAQQTREKLLDILESPGLYQVEAMPRAQVQALQETLLVSHEKWLQETAQSNPGPIRAILAQLDRQVRAKTRDAHQRQTSALDQLILLARTFDMQKEAWSAQPNQKPAKRTQREIKRYQRISFTRIARNVKRNWQKKNQLLALQSRQKEMRQARQAWHVAAESYSQAQAMLRLRTRLSAYADGFGEIPLPAGLNSREKLSSLAALSQAMPTPSLAVAFEKAAAAYDRWALSQQAFVEASGKMNSLTSKPVIRQEYLIYLKRLARAEQRLKDLMARNSDQVQQALMAAKLGQGAKERELFARASEKRLDRELQKTKARLRTEVFRQEIAPAEKLLASLQKKLANIQTASGREMKNNLQALRVQQDRISAAIPQQLRELARFSRTRGLQAELDWLKNSAEERGARHAARNKTRHMLPKIHQSILALADCGELAQQSKQYFVQDPDVLKRDSSSYENLKAMHGLSQRRRQLVRALVNQGAYQAQRVAAWDWSQWAARLEVLPEIIAAGEPGIIPEAAAEQLQTASRQAWALAGRQSTYLVWLDKKLDQHQKRLDLRLALQAAADKMYQQILSADRIMALQDAENKLRDLEKHLARVNEQTRQVEQLFFAKERMQALQVKTQEYLGKVRDIKNNSPAATKEIQQAWGTWDNRAQAAAKSLRTSDWEQWEQNTRQRLAGENTRIQALQAELSKLGILPVQEKEQTLTAKEPVSADTRVKYEHVLTQIRVAQTGIKRKLRKERKALASTSLPALAAQLDTLSQGDAAIKKNVLQKELRQSRALVQAAVFASQSLAKTSTIKIARKDAQTVVSASVDLLGQHVAQSQVLRNLDQVKHAEALLQKKIDRLPSKARRVWEKSGLFQEMKKIGLDRDKISTVVNIMNKTLSARLQSQGWQLNCAELKSATKHMQSLLKLLPPASRQVLGDKYSQVLKTLDKAGAVSGQDLAKQISRLDLAMTWNNLGRALGQAGDAFSLTGPLVQAGRAPPDISQALQGLTDVRQLYQSGIQQGASFLRQQATRREVQEKSDHVASLGYQAEALLDQHVSDIHIQLAKSGFMTEVGKLGLSSTAHLALEQAAARFGLNASLDSIRQELANLQNIKTIFNEGLERQLLEIQRADAALVVERVSQKFASLGNDFQAAWKSLTYQLDPGHWSFDPAFNLSNLAQFGIDQELLQTFQNDIFNKLLQSNPILKEFEKLGDLSGQLDSLAGLGGQKLKSWLSGTGAYARIEKLAGLQQKAESLLDQAISQGQTELLKGDLGKLLRQIGLESHEITDLFNSVSGPLKDLFMESGIMQQLNLLQDLPGFVDSHINTLLNDLECAIRNTGFMRSLEGLSQQFEQVWSQLSGETPLNLSSLGLQLIQGFGAVGNAGQQVLEQLQRALDSLGSAGGALALWDGIQQGLQDFMGGVVQGLGDFITSACNLDLGAAFLNFTSVGSGLLTQAGDLLGRFFSDVFEFNFDFNGSWFDAEGVWDQIANIFNSELFQFDFYQAADGFMQAIGDGISDLIDSGLQWVNDRWQEYYDQAEEYLDILLGGPGRWLDELASGRWASSISSVLDRYLPPEWQAARSALEQITLMFGEDFEFSADFLLGILDNLSTYLSEDALEIYQDLRGWYDQGQEYYGIGEQAWEAIQSGDLTSVVSMVSRLFGSLNLLWGPVYRAGQGRADKLGGYRGESGDLFTSPLDEYLAQIDPALRAEIQQALREQRFGSAAYAGNDIDVADYAGYPPGAFLTTGLVEGGARGVGAGLDPSLPNGGGRPDWDTGPDNRGHPRMNGVPTPPGRYWDPNEGEHGAWVKEGEGGEEGEASSDDKDKPGIWPRVGAVLKEGAKTWVDPRRLGPKADKVNQGIANSAENVKDVVTTKEGRDKLRNALKEGAKTIADPRRLKSKAEKLNEKAGKVVKKAGGALLEAGDEAVLEDVRNAHYDRNNYNTVPIYEKDVPEDWIKYPPELNIYHTQGEGNENNVKYVSPDGKLEGIYKDGQLVTDPLNMGTYNYASPNNNWIGHVILDVVPYNIWGNSPDAPSTFEDRITLPFKNENQNGRKEEEYDE